MTVRNRHEKREYTISLLDNVDTHFKDHIVQIQIIKQQKKIEITLESDFLSIVENKKGFARKIKDLIIKLLT